MQHLVLDRAKEKRQEILVELAHWERFILDYEELSGLRISVDESLDIVLGKKKPKRKIHFPQIRIKANEMKELIAKLYNQGLSVDEICEKVERKRNTVLMYITMIKFRKQKVRIQKVPEKKAYIFPESKRYVPDRLRPPLPEREVEEI